MSFQMTILCWCTGVLRASRTWQIALFGRVLTNSTCCAALSGVLCAHLQHSLASYAQVEDLVRIKFAGCRPCALFCSLSKKVLSQPPCNIAREFSSPHPRSPLLLFHSFTISISVSLFLPANSTIDDNYCLDGLNLFAILWML